VISVEKSDLHARLKDELGKCWNTYRDSILTLTPAQIMERAAEISATRFCYNMLTKNTAVCPDYLLEHLLTFDDPLEAIREQWMDEQWVDLSGEFEHAMWSLWDHGQKPDEAPNAGGMTMA